MYFSPIRVVCCCCVFFLSKNTFNRRLIMRYDRRTCLTIRMIRHALRMDAMMLWSWPTVCCCFECIINLTICHHIERNKHRNARTQSVRPVDVTASLWLAYNGRMMQNQRTELNPMRMCTMSPSEWYSNEMHVIADERNTYRTCHFSDIWCE